MILVDSSVWVSFLRADGSPAHGWLRDAAATPAQIVTTEPVIMELLAGATSAAAERRIDDVLSRVGLASVEVGCDFREAAALARAARARGGAVRGVIDCLIATVAVRTGLPLAHRDSDFARIADVVDLATIDLRDGVAGR